MALVVPGVGEQIALAYMVNKELPSDLVLRIYANDVTPSNSDTDATYTEVSGGGYAAKTLAGASWSIAGSGPATAIYPAQTWTFSGGVGNVYGYYVTRSGGGDLLWAERFGDGPYNVANAGDTVTVTPVITGS
jgi:phage baseplate assembly protein gpV